MLSIEMWLISSVYAFWISWPNGNELIASCNLSRSVPDWAKWGSHSINSSSLREKAKGKAPFCHSNPIDPKVKNFHVQGQNIQGQHETSNFVHLGTVVFWHISRLLRNDVMNIWACLYFSRWECWRWPGSQNQQQSLTVQLRPGILELKQLSGP
jgi:hypothetical protein